MEGPLHNGKPSSLFESEVVAERYILKRLVHSGSRGEVWEGETRDHQLRVALKFSWCALCDRDSAPKNEATIIEDGARIAAARDDRDAALEARVLEQVQSRFVARLVDQGRHAGRHFIATEWIDGTLLDRWIPDRSGDARGRWRRIRPVVSRLVEALTETHRHGYVHGDLAPRNVIMKTADVDPTPVLLDFGLAGRQHGGREHDAYTGPELKDLEALTPAFDVYGLAVIVIELWCGSNCAPHDRYWREVSGEGDDALGAALSERLGDAPAALLEHLVVAMRRDPARRRGAVGSALGDAAAFLAGLDAALETAEHGGAPVQEVDAPAATADEPKARSQDEPSAPPSIDGPAPPNDRPAESATDQGGAPQRTRRTRRAVLWGITDVAAAIAMVLFASQSPRQGEAQPYSDRPPPPRRVVAPIARPPDAIPSPPLVPPPAPTREAPAVIRSANVAPRATASPNGPVRAPARAARRALCNLQVINREYGEVWLPEVAAREARGEARFPYGPSGPPAEVVFRSVPCMVSLVCCRIPYSDGAFAVRPSFDGGVGHASCLSSPGRHVPDPACER